MDVAQMIAESAIEATMCGAKYWDSKEEYQSAIKQCNAGDMRIYAEIMGIDSPTNEDIVNALTIYHSKSSMDRMMNKY